MLAVCASGAANAAAAYRGPNNKTDWYLPAEGELMVMYAKLMRERGKGGFGYDACWSSSEYANYLAWSQLFTTGDQYGTSKDSGLRVRPVRAF